MTADEYFFQKLKNNEQIVLGYGRSKRKQHKKRWTYFNMLLASFSCLLVWYTSHVYLIFSCATLFILFQLTINFWYKSLKSVYLKGDAFIIKDYQHKSTIAPIGSIRRVSNTPIGTAVLTSIHYKLDGIHHVSRCYTDRSNSKLIENLISRSKEIKKDKKADL